MPIVTETVDEESLAMVEDYADAVQIGARNMQNFSLLKRAGRSKIPVFLKRGLSATLDEFLMAAEYIVSEGNYQVFLCERGVRTFADHTRNTLDLAIVPAVKHLSHLPILVDPSHGTGRRDKVAPLALAAVAAGSDGIMVEVHHEPAKALSDGPQSILPEQFAALVRCRAWSGGRTSRRGRSGYHSAIVLTVFASVPSPKPSPPWSPATARRRNENTPRHLARSRGMDTVWYAPCSIGRGCTTASGGATWGMGIVRGRAGMGGR